MNKIHTSKKSKGIQSDIDLTENSDFKHGVYDTMDSEYRYPGILPWTSDGILIENHVSRKEFYNRFDFNFDTIQSTLNMYVTRNTNNSSTTTYFFNNSYQFDFMDVEDVGSPIILEELDDYHGEEEYPRWLFNLKDEGLDICIYNNELVSMEYMYGNKTYSDFDISWSTSTSYLNYDSIKFDSSVAYRIISPRDLVNIRLSNAELTGRVVITGSTPEEFRLKYRKYLFLNKISKLLSWKSGKIISSNNGIKLETCERCGKQFLNFEKNYSKLCSDCTEKELYSFNHSPARLQDMVDIHNHHMKFRDNYDYIDDQGEYSGIINDKSIDYFVQSVYRDRGLSIIRNTQRGAVDELYIDIGSGKEYTMNEINPVWKSSYGNHLTTDKVTMYGLDEFPELIEIIEQKRKKRDEERRKELDAQLVLREFNDLNAFDYEDFTWTMVAT